MNPARLGPPAPPPSQTAEEGCWPTPDQELLLRAAVLPGPRALEAWREWSHNRDLDALESPSRRLLPQVYRNLHRHGFTHPLMPKLKESFGRAYLRNCVLFRHAAELLRNFHDHGISTLVLKGAALIPLYYKEYGVRPMEDVDVLVRASDARAAMALLRRFGWRATYYDPPEARIALTHSTAFSDAAHRQVDLHWHVLTDCWHADRDEVFWERSSPIEIEGVWTRALDPTMQLLHVCAHGVHWDRPAPIRWIIDAMAVLAAGEAIDWVRLASETDYRRLNLPMSEALEYLRLRLDAPAPPSAIAMLRSRPIPTDERFAYETDTGPYHILSVREVVRVLAYDYRRLGSTVRGWRRLRAFVGRAQSRWGLTRAWQLPLTVLTGLTRRTIRAASTRGR